MSPDEEEQTEAPAPEQEQPAEAKVEAAPPTAEPKEEAPDAAPVARPAAAPTAPTSEARRPSRDRNGDDDDSGRGGERRRRFFGRRRVCTFCVDKVASIDYKDPAKLRRYVSDRARIEARRRTGTCAKHQRWLAVALKRARHLALLPYTPEHIRLSGTFAPRREREGGSFRR